MLYKLPLRNIAHGIIQVNSSKFLIIKKSLNEVF